MPQIPRKNDTLAFETAGRSSVGFFPESVGTDGKSALDTKTLT
jgi:hypothetical protein